MPINIPRLVKLAEALESPLPKKLRKSKARYDQTRFVHSCGTPACALGYYAQKSEGRFYFNYERAGEYWHFRHFIFGSSVIAGAIEEFGITNAEANTLFGGLGCGNAQSRKQAAKFVREFIASKQLEQQQENSACVSQSAKI